MSVNMAILVGNLGKDPDVRFTQTGAAVCSFSMATSEKFQGQDGNQKERTEWHNIVVFGAQAEPCGKYLAKGRQVYVQGRIQTDEWTDKDGNNRRTTKIVAQRVQFLGGNQGGGGQQQGGGDQYAAPSGYQYAQTPPGDDDVPF